MVNRDMRWGAALLALVLTASVATAWAYNGGDCCHSCGCQNDCDKVCRVICEKKKITKTKYICECEDFCIPGRSCLIGEECVEDCESCTGTKTRKIWEPGCATVHTRKKLVKKTITEEVPHFKWVVESCCPQCQSKLAADQASVIQEMERTGAKVAAAPAGVPPIYSGKNVPTVQPAAYFDLAPRK